MKLTVILEPDTTGYHIYSPSLPGCHSQGESEVEALRNFAEALEGWLTVQMEVEKEAGGRRDRPSGMQAVCGIGCSGATKHSAAFLYNPRPITLRGGKQTNEGLC